MQVDIIREGGRNAAQNGCLHILGKSAFDGQVDQEVIAGIGHNDIFQACVFGENLICEQDQDEHRDENGWFF